MTWIDLLIIFILLLGCYCCPEYLYYLVFKGGHRSVTALLRCNEVTFLSNDVTEVTFCSVTSLFCWSTRTDKCAKKGGTEINYFNL